jgi:hypothetical protein
MYNTHGGITIHAMETCIMTEVTAAQAAAIIGRSAMTVHRKVEDGVLSARQEGTGERKFTFIDLSDLREFAAKYGYRFNEDVAKQFEE